jgi:hypothetical protein
MRLRHRQHLTFVSRKGCGARLSRIIFRIGLRRSPRGWIEHASFGRISGAFQENYGGTLARDR